jgi:hypothetical protein
MVCLVTSGRAVAPIAGKIHLAELAMAEVTYHAVVWIGVVGVVPQEGCELLAPQEGAFINF